MATMDRRKNRCTTKSRKFLLPQKSKRISKWSNFLKLREKSTRDWFSRE